MRNLTGQSALENQQGTAAKMLHESAIIATAEKNNGGNQQQQQLAEDETSEAIVDEPGQEATPADFDYWLSVALAHKPSAVVLALLLSMFAIYISIKIGKHCTCCTCTCQRDDKSVV